MSSYDTAFSDRLTSALKDAVAEFNSCKDPSEAVAKTACDYGFGASGTRRLLESFNRARTIYHFETAGDNKEAEFDLAEPDKVFKAMHTQKTAAPICDSIKAASYMADAYTIPDRDYNAPAESYVKEAEAVDHELEAHKQFTKLARLQSGLRRSIDMSCDVIGIEVSNIDRCLNKVAQYMISEAREANDVQSRFLELKEACTRDAIQGVAEKLQEKVAGYLAPELPETNFPSVMDTRKYDKSLDLLKQAAEALSNYAEAEAIKEAMVQELEGINETIKNLARPDETKQAEEPGIASFFNKRAGLYEAGPLKVDVARSSTGEANPAFKGVGKELNNLHRQLLLQDLMLTDPVISKADPNSVVSAYQNILNLSPEIANQKATVIPILRQSLNAPDAFSPYDALQMTKLDRAMKANTGSVAPRKEDE